MKIGIDGIGVWAAGIDSWTTFQLGLVNGFSLLAQKSEPASLAIPVRERRRAPLVVRLAMEVTGQAATMAGADQAKLCSVFCSAMGDSHITDYMSRTLSGADKLLSPTRFHNSVHNATSGYWSISVGNQLSSSFVCAFRESFAAGLLEATILAIAESRSTVLVVYDVSFGQPLYDIYPADEDFAAAFIINPDPTSARWQIKIDLESGFRLNPIATDSYVQSRIDRNPSAIALLLGEMLVGRIRQLHLPLQPGLNFLNLEIH